MEADGVGGDVGLDGGGVHGVEAVRCEAAELGDVLAEDLVGDGAADGRCDGEAVAGEAGGDEERVESGIATDIRDLVDADGFKATPAARYVKLIQQRDQACAV